MRDYKSIVVFLLSYFLFTSIYAQSENWIYRYNGFGNDDDMAYSIIYGPDGNLYAAGYCTSSSISSSDFTVISLTTAGDTNWVYRYDGPLGNQDRANSIVYGEDGNLYVAGYSTGIGTSSDFTVISLTTAGDTNWIYRFNGSGDGEDVASSIVYGEDGNVYITGYSTGSGTSYDLIVISLTAAGDTNWIYLYNAQGNGGDRATSIVYGLDGNLYAAGSSSGVSSGPDFIVISLTTAGDSNWVYRYNGPSNDEDWANSIVYGDDGNIYAVGSSYDTSGFYDFIVISLTTAGDTNWIYKADRPGIGNAIIYGMDGSLYAAGRGRGGGTTYNFMVNGLTIAGDTNWTYMYNGQGSANSIVYGADYNLYAAGQSVGGASYDLILISLMTGGDTNWVYRYNGPGNGDDRAYSIVYGPDSILYIAGGSDDSSSFSDFIVISLSPYNSVQEEKTAVPKKYNYVRTIYRGSLQLPSDKPYKIFDIMGREIHTINPAPGIYFIEVEGKITQKIIKIK